MTHELFDSQLTAVEDTLDVLDEEVFVFPLSFAQQRLWFMEQLGTGSPTYNLPFALHFQGVLDVKALELSINEIIQRHESLRTTFTIVEGQPVQAIAPSLTLSLRMVDLIAIPQTEQAAELQRLVHLEIQQPFNLEQDPLLRVTLFHQTQQDYLLLLNMHHIISDGWSCGVFIKELTALYKAFASGKPSPLPELPIQYADFSLWQQDALQGEALETKLSYWKQQLGGNLPCLQLPTDHLRPVVQSFRGERQSFVVSKSLTEALKARSRQEGVTLFVTLLTAFQTLLYRYTNSEDILVGLPIAERQQTEIEGLIGFFVNTLALRTDLSDSPSFRQLLLRVREATLGAYAHQDAPFEKLVESLQLERDLSQNPLFQVMFAFQNVPLPVLDGGWSWSQIELHTGTAKFDLTLELSEWQDELIGWFEYSTDLFESATIARMVGHFQTLLAGIVTDPEQKISKLPLLTQPEQHQLLVEWNQTQTDYPRNACIHELFEEQVERSPDAVAVVFAGEQLTYRELNAKANQLAHHLRTLGVKPEVMVGICVERSLELVVGILGILKAGGVYVPLDTAYPQERLSFMLEDAQVSVLLTQARLVELLPKNLARIVCLDTDWQGIAQQSVENPVHQGAADHLAYVMYTSGTTGKPKGVSVLHRGVVRLVKETDYVHLSAEDVFLQLAPIAFDASTLEIWGCLLNGARLVVMPPYSPSLQDLGQAIERYQVTILWLTAGLFHLMVDEQIQSLKPVRQLLAGGDVLSVPHIKKVLEKLEGCRVINGYGPTENTTFTCCYSITNPSQLGHSVPIGRAIANTQVYLLDAQLQPVPIGVPGELYIGGDGLARGYLNRPEINAERFIPNLFSNKGSDRLYKTGDLARYLADGNIEFLGRIDNQVKIRGFRIELGEIEAVFGQHPDVREVVVVAREDVPNNKQIVAYFVSNFIPERVPYQTTCLVHFKGHNSLKLMTEDLAAGGVGLIGVPATLPSGTQVRLCLSFPGGVQEQWLEGNIAWNQGHWAGIKLALTPTQQALMRQSVEYILEKQGFLKVLQHTAIRNLRRFLKQKLPSYMIPDRFVVMNSLPLTPNGKVDRRMLPKPERDRPELEETLITPRTPIEQQMVNLWARVLGVEKVGINDNFFELGGNSLLAAKLIAYVRESFQVELPIRYIFEKPTVEGLVQTIQTVKQGGIAALNTVLDLQAEAVLPSEIFPNTTSIDVAQISEPQHIFLTGATGFLGAFLVDELLRETQAQIYCLVRASNEREGLQKLQANLEKHSLWNPNLSSRIIPIPGDLEQPLLGISPEKFAQLALEIDTIYHSGAQVNFVKPYSVIKAANVLGTQEVLRLACQEKVKPVHYMSTSGILVNSRELNSQKVIYEDDDIDVNARYLDMGYLESKWVAEKLVWIAQSRGLPVNVFRLGFVMGHSQTGSNNTEDLSSRMIKGCIQMGSFPELLDKKEQFLPVDFASRAIVHLSRKIESFGKAFHIVPTQPIPFVELFELIRDYGYSLKKLPYKEWQKELIYQTRYSQENALSPLVPLFSEEVDQNQVDASEVADKTPTFDCQNMLDGLAGTDIVCPPTDAKLLETYLSYFIRSGFLPRP